MQLTFNRRFVWWLPASGHALQGDRKRYYCAGYFALEAPDTDTRADTGGLNSNSAKYDINGKF